MCIHIYLHANDPVTQTKDGGYPAWNSPEASLHVPPPARAFDNRVQVPFMRFYFHQDHLDRSCSDGRTVHHQLNRRVTDFALGIRAMSDAYQCLSVLLGQFNGAAVGWCKRLDDPVVDAVAFHGAWCGSVGWRMNSV